MRGTPSSARAAALIAGGSLVVHELRYLLAPTGAVGHGGHAYLPLLHLLIALALAGACVQLVVAVARAGSGHRNADRAHGRGFFATWGLAGAAVLAVFTGQELIEGALTAGRTPGLAAVFGDGGWVAPLLAIGAGLFVAAGLRGADAAIAAAGRTGVAESSIRPPLVSRGSPVAPRRRVPALADHLAGRAPPLAA